MLSALDLATSHVGRAVSKVMEAWVRGSPQSYERLCSSPAAGKLI